MRKILRSLVFSMLSILPVKKRILLESHPDLTGNTYQVYQEMLKNGLNDEYELTWFVLDVDKYNHIKVKNVFFREYTPSSKFRKLKNLFYIARSSLILDENKMIIKVNKKTKRIFLNHGTLLKNVKGIYSPGRNADHVIIASEGMSDIYVDCFDIDKEQIKVLGAPRNDVLFKNNIFKWNELIPSYQNEKVIIWMPTFRQHKQNRIDSINTLPLGVPIIYSIRDFEIINTLAKQYNIFLLLKLHPAQDLSYLKIKDLSNVKIILEEQFRSINKELYEILPHTDALITDYSSIYFDYLLLNKPVAFTNDDIESYKLGFVFDDLENVLIGSKLSNLEDLKSFMNNIYLETDEFVEKRAEVNKYFNTYQDNQSAKRVYNLVLECLTES
ncbi:CDP-glycerol glycerophosphotransferase family protein [Caryophanon latum]|uniref:CDP-glycerol--glycerophosphate glycerophosphotransferase n=1 Tax=Caryophanon latum TaxID=33977 RepID=A0A1C0YIS8_9BACL|nr:CDP-glycerol glycerophosphotransferase family protein [Caryophanon latum]OCS87053.1 hypothetical protein A6K76_14055 [Caryophanon latum]